MAEEERNPPPVPCGNKACRCQETVPSKLKSVSPTGRRTQLFVCRRCLCGTWTWWVPDRPNVWIVVSVEAPVVTTTRQALIGLGYLPPKGKRDYWTDPNGVPVERP